MPEQIKTIKSRCSSRDLGIRVKTGEYIGINKTVIQALNHPAHLNFWWGEDEKVLAIGTSDEPMDMSVFVPSYFYHTRKGSKIMNWKLMRAIQAFTGWEDKSVHRLVGELIPELRIIVFKTIREGHEGTPEDFV